MLTYRSSASTPTLSCPTALAAASVEPEPANGSRITPSSSGRTDRTKCRKNACGLSEGWGAMARSARGVGLDLITSPNGRSAPIRRYPPVFHFRKLSWTRPSNGRRSITHGSHIPRGITLTSENSRWAFFGRPPPRIVITSRTMFPRGSSPASVMAEATMWERRALLAMRMFAPGTTTRLRRDPNRLKTCEARGDRHRQAR